MAEISNIEWCDSTFNPWEGCTKIGPGCDNCYAETRNKRFKGGNWGPGAPRRRTTESNWRLPVKWDNKPFYECNECRWRGEKPYLGEPRNFTYGAGSCPICDSFDIKETRRRVFCASLADVFDNEIDHAWRADLFDLIESTPNLDWLVLTKRIGNVQRMVAPRWSHKLPGNVLLGATVVNQEEVDRDIPKLLCTPAAAHFISAEPLLGPIEIPKVFMERLKFDGREFEYPDNAGQIDWVVAGGESGKNARPLHPDWIRSLRDQCTDSHVPFLFKQWGEWAPNCLCDTSTAHPTIKRPEPGKPGVMFRCGKSNAGREIDGRTWTEFPA